MDKEIYSLEIYPDYTGLDIKELATKSDIYLKSIDYTGLFVVCDNKLFRKDSHKPLEHRIATLPIRSNLEAISKMGAVFAVMQGMQEKVYYSPEKILSKNEFNFINSQKKIFSNIESIRIN